MAAMSDRPAAIATSAAVSRFLLRRSLCHCPRSGSYLRCDRQRDRAFRLARQEAGLWQTCTGVQGRTFYLCAARSVVSLSHRLLAALVRLHPSPQRCIRSHTPRHEQYGVCADRFARAPGRSTMRPVPGRQPWHACATVESNPNELNYDLGWDRSRPRLQSNGNVHGQNRYPRRLSARR